MKKERKYLVVLLVMYALFLSTKKAEVYVPFISDYASDLVCLPLTLLIIEFIFARIPKISFKVNDIAIVVAVIYFSLVFEWIMPRLSSNYTADGWDVVCYAAGGIFFRIIKNQRILST